MEIKRMPEYHYSSGKRDFKIKTVTRDKEGHYWSGVNSTRTHNNYNYSPNTEADQRIRQTLIAIKGETDGNTIMQWSLQCAVSQSCLTSCDPHGCSPPGSSVCEILQARILECGARPFSRGIPLTRDLNPGLLCWGQTLYHLNPGEAQHNDSGGLQHSTKTNGHIVQTENK